MEALETFHTNEPEEPPELDTQPDDYRQCFARAYLRALGVEWPGQLVATMNAETLDHYYHALTTGQIAMGGTLREAS